MRLAKLGILTQVGAALAFGAGNVLAQDDKDSRALEEITVTAQKYEQNLQEVPLAVSALMGDDLAKQGV